jgi:hypothetical protein
MMNGKQGIAIREFPDEPHGELNLIEHSAFTIHHLFIIRHSSFIIFLTLPGASG